MHLHRAKPSLTQCHQWIIPRAPRVRLWTNQRLFISKSKALGSQQGWRWRYPQKAIFQYDAFDFMHGWSELRFNSMKTPVMAGPGLGGKWILASPNLCHDSSREVVELRDWSVKWKLFFQKIIFVSNLVAFYVEIFRREEIRKQSQ